MNLLFSVTITVTISGVPRLKGICFAAAALPNANTQNRVRGLILFTTQNCFDFLLSQQCFLTFLYFFLADYIVENLGEQMFLD